MYRALVVLEVESLPHQVVKWPFYHIITIIN